jgi:hypothetical protein
MVFFAMIETGECQLRMQHNCSGETAVGAIGQPGTAWAFSNPAAFSTGYRGKTGQSRVVAIEAGVHQLLFGFGTANWTAAFGLQQVPELDEESVHVSATESRLVEVQLSPNIDDLRLAPAQRTRTAEPTRASGRGEGEVDLSIHDMDVNTVRRPITAQPVNQLAQPVLIDVAPILCKTSSDVGP